jgi:hypothetical protein
LRFRRQCKHNYHRQHRTANGQRALGDNTIGNNLTGIGVHALTSNTTGSFNTAVGSNAMYSNTTGSQNVATGNGALSGNTTASFNTAVGWAALGFNTTGNGNAAGGNSALAANTGIDNTATGFKALLQNTTGSDNIALGFDAGSNLTTGSHNIDISSTGVAAESGTIRIGDVQTRTFIHGIRGVTTAHAAIPVVIDTVGQLGTMSSSARFKDEIKPMDKASEAILALKPVTFHYKKELDAECIPQFGLVAEDVEKVNPDLVARDAKGEIYTVRYDAVNAMLLNEFLKEHSEVQELKKQVAALTAGLQKVSAQLEVSKSAPQTVLNDQ